MSATYLDGRLVLFQIVSGDRLDERFAALWRRANASGWTNIITPLRCSSCCCWSALCFQMSRHSLTGVGSMQAGRILKDDNTLRAKAVRQHISYQDPVKYNAKHLYVGLRWPHTPAIPTIMVRVRRLWSLRELRTHLRDHWPSWAY